MVLVVNLEYEIFHLPGMPLVANPSPNFEAGGVQWLALTNIDIAGLGLYWL